MHRKSGAYCRYVPHRQRLQSKMIAANTGTYSILAATPGGVVALFCIAVVIVAVVAFKMKSR
jgi:hypothetical protein